MRTRSRRAAAHRPSHALLSAAVLAALAHSAGAQSYPWSFAQLHKQHLPSATERTSAVAWGDVDGDGDVDLVVGSAQNRLYRNDGHGVLTDITATSLPPGGAHALVFGDVDNDGDLDLVCGEPDRILVNDGAGTFTAAPFGTLPPQPPWQPAASLVVGDVDGDGDLDLVVGRTGYCFLGYCYVWQASLYLNDGSGTFTDATASQLAQPNPGWTTAVALGDVDGDGDLDLIAGAEATGYPSGSHGNLYRNDGAGTFTEVSATHWPGAHNERAMALGDVDGDGDLDLVTSDGTSDRLYTNGGNGVFATSRLVATAAGTRTLALADVDGDGDLDLIAGGAGQNRLLRNDGAGNFADATATGMPALAEQTNALALADVDGDGDLDLAIANDGVDRLHLNSGGAFVDVTDPAQALAPTLTLACGDIDGDGDTDVVTGGAVYRNDGADFAVVLEGYAANAVALGDVDGDGDLDLVACGDQRRLYVNQGNGTFVQAGANQLASGTVPTVSVSLGDVDGDGDLDLVIGNPGSGNDLLFVNDGSGAFSNVTPTHLPPIRDNTSDTALVDVDGDGDLDLLTANVGEQNRLLLNDGTGHFTDVTGSRLPAVRDTSLDLVAGDVDHDGDLDLVIGNQGQNLLYLNDGNGFFTDATATRLPQVLDATGAVALGDLDGDGDLDLVVGNGSFAAEQSRCYLNDGNGTFTDVTASWIPPIARQTYSVALADFDGDLDPDLVLGDWTGHSSVLFNLHRQLHTPHALRAGHGFPVEVHARDIAAGATALALPYLSLTRVSIPVPPYGTIGITPDIGLGFMVVPPTEQFAATVQNVPNLPAVAGLVVFGQAVILTTTGDIRLTNVTRDEGMQ